MLPTSPPMAASAITLPSCPPVVLAPGLGGTRRAEHRCPRFRVTWGHPRGPPPATPQDASPEHQQEAARAPPPELAAAPLRPTLGRPHTDGPPLPTLPQQGQARPSRGQTRGCTSHLLSAHRTGPQVKPSQVPKACVLGCGSVRRARPWGSPRLCPLQGGRHRVPPGQMTSAGGRSRGLEVSPCLLQWGPRVATEPLTFTGFRRTFEHNH